MDFWPENTPSIVARILRVLSQILIFTWIMEPILEKSTWNCFKFLVTMFVDTVIAFCWPGCCPDRNIAFAMGASPCLLLLFHLLANGLTVILMAPAINRAHNLHCSWTRLLLFLRFCLGIVDPFFGSCADSIVFGCLPRYDRCTEWCDNLADFLFWCLRGRRRRRNHRRGEGQEGHFSDSSDGDSDNNNNQNEAAENDPVNQRELIEAMNAQALV